MYATAVRALVPLVRPVNSAQRPLLHELKGAPREVTYCVVLNLITEPMKAFPLLVQAGVGQAPEQGDLLVLRGQTSRECIKAKVAMHGGCKMWHGSPHPE